MLKLTLKPTMTSKNINKPSCFLLYAVSVVIGLSLAVGLFNGTITTVTGHLTTDVKQCRSSFCTGLECPQVACKHGNCSFHGLCVCSPCWNGTSCDLLKNEYYPEFTSQHQRASVDSSAEVGHEVIQLKSFDYDLQSTCQSNPNDCDCAIITYAIESGNENDLFRIDIHTGLITLAKPAIGYNGRSLKLYVTVVNQQAEGETGGDIIGPKNYAVVIVTVGSAAAAVASSDTTYDHDNQLDGTHERHRRSVSQVTNMTFYLFKTGEYNYSTVMYIGSSVHFQLQIEFPVGTMDLLVELFTPDNTSTVMIVCNPQITWIGNNIVFNQTEAQPVMDSLDGSTNYDRAVLDFGNVTTTNQMSDSANRSMIFIEWDAVMINDNLIQNGSLYWVSAGAEYNSQNEIWVGQAGFTAILDNYTTSAYPTFNVTAPAFVELSTSTIIRVDMYIPYVISQLEFEAFSPLNLTDAMSVCSAMIVSVGQNYDCLQYQNIFATLYQSSTGATNDRAVLNIGEVINKGLRAVTPLTDSRISVEFVVYMPYNESLIGQTLWLGATLEIGTSQIWAGQIGVVIANTSLSSQAVTPSFTMIPMSETAINLPAAVEYNMTVNNNTSTGYTLTVTVPTGRFKICSVSVIYQGINIPCLTNVLPVYNSSDNSGNNDKAIWNLGQILNTGQRSTALDFQANVMQFMIYVVPLNVPTNNPPSSAIVTAIMAYSQGIPTKTTTTVVIAALNASNDVTNASIPISNMTFNFGNNNVFINASTDIRLNISLYPGVVYSPFTIEVTAPYQNNSNVFSICRMEVVSVGRNLACLNQAYLNSSVQYYTMVNGTPNYRAVLSVGSACNVAFPPVNGTFVPSANDSMEIRIIVTVENHPILLTSPTNWVGAGLTYGPGLLWLGAQAITASNSYNIGYGVNATPYINLSDNNDTTTSTMVAPGSIASFLVLIKLAPETTADWVITADAGLDNDINVCSVHVAEFGYGIPCLNTSIPMRSVQRPNGQGRQKGWLELYKLTNVDSQPINNNSVFDNNTVTIEVIVQMSTSAVSGLFHGVNIYVDYGMNGVDATTNMTLLVGSTQPFVIQQNSTLPSFNFSLTPVNVNATVSESVYKGQTLILTSAITVPRNSINDVWVTFSVPITTANVMDIVRYDAVYVGVNIPCLSKEMVISNITSRQHSYDHDIGVIHLGSVCNVPIDTSKPENDEILVEAIATVIRNSSLTTGDIIIVTSTLTVNSTDVYVQTIPLTIISPASSIEYISSQGILLANVVLNVTNGSVVYMGPSDFYSFYADIVVPPNSSVFALVDVALPVYQSAVMTVVNLYVVSMGCNLGSFGLPTDFPVYFNSSLHTSQNDTAFITMGKLTNTGHTYRADTYEPGDDSFRISLTVQMADSAVAVKNAQFPISIGAIVGTPIIFQNLTVQVIRTLTEVPDLLITAAINNSIIYAAGNQMIMIGHLKHSNLSKAEGYNTSVLFYLPKYLQFTYIDSTNFLGPTPTIVNISGSNAIAFEFSHFFFTDSVAFSLNLAINPVPPGLGSPETTSISVEVVTNIIYRLNDMNASGTLFPSQLENITTMVNPPIVQQCVSVALGMQNYFIQNCQITGSVSPYPCCQPIMARPQSSLGWVSSSRLGPFSRYIQVNFGNVTKVTSIILENPTGNTELVTSYQLLYSTDGINWANGEIVNPSFISETASNTLLSPTDTIYIRLEILSSTNGRMAEFQVEFYGCVTNILPVTPSELCDAYEGWQSPTTSLADFYTRGFVVANGIVFFCDTNPNGGMDCFSSTNGFTWQALDDTVVNVNGYLPSTGELYGIDWNKRAFLISEDQGTNWMSVSSVRYLWAKAQPGYSIATDVPWLYQSPYLDPTSVNPVSPYTSGQWGAQYNGLYSQAAGSWNQVSDWMQCCP